MFLRFCVKLTFYMSMSFIISIDYGHFHHVIDKTKNIGRTVLSSMSNSLLTSNFLITLIKAMKKNKTAVQNEWDRYRINNSFL